MPQAPIEIPIILRPALDREQFGTGLGDEIQAEFERAQRAARELQDLLQGVDLSLRDIGNADITGPRAAAEQLSGTILDLNRGLDAVVGASRNVGLIGDEAARAIGDVLALGDAIGQVIRQASTGNILGLVGAGIGVLGGLLGPSPAEIERNRILARHNDLLERNNALLAVQQGGAGGLAGLGLTTAQLAAIENLEFAGRTGAKGMELGGSATDALNAILEEAGLSLKVFAAQVEAATGIELLDSKGRIVAEAFDQAKEAIDRMVEAATHFGTSLSEQDAVLRARDALGLGPNAGLPPDVQALARTRELELSGLNLDAALEAKIAGLDLGTEEGRQAFLEFNRMLFTLADNGDLTAKQLGTFADVDELLGPITDAATGINPLGESALDAANELSIVPEGFRSAALAFEAQIPGLTAAFPARKIDQPVVNFEGPIEGKDALDHLIPEPIQITGAELLDRLIAVGQLPSSTGLPAAVPGDGAALPQIAASVSSSAVVLTQIAASLSTLRPDPAETQASQRETTAVLGRLAELLSKAKIGQNIENVTIEVDAESQDGDALAREIVQRLQNISMADFGRTDKWGQT